jgi:phosphoribosyl-AMP cyclohydrolase
MRVRDPVSLRVHSRIAAELAPRLLLGVNPAPLACDRRDAIRLALELPEAPTGYRGDMTLCLGLASGEDEAVAEAIERLATGLLALLRARNAAVDPQQGVSVALSSGAFERHVTAAFAAAPR